MIVAVAIPAVIAAAKVADVPAAQKTAITVHVPAARIESTKLQDKNEEINKFLLFL
mgnify:CR=1 FL=1